MSIQSKFKSLTDDELIDWVVSRIEQEDWQDDLTPLNEQERDFIRCLRFQILFGNGGLQRFFEVDGFGIATADSLDRIDQPIFANAIREMFRNYPAVPGCPYSIDLDRYLEAPDDDIEKREETLWEHFEELIPSIARMVRRYAECFKHLESINPYIPY